MSRCFWRRTFIAGNRIDSAFAKTGSLCNRETLRMTLRARGLPIFSPRSILNRLRSNDLGIVCELEADELEGSLSMSSIFFFGVCLHRPVKG